MTTNYQSNYASMLHSAVQVQFQEFADCTAGAGRVYVTKDVKQSDPWPEGGEANI